MTRTRATVLVTALVAVAAAGWFVQKQRRPVERERPVFPTRPEEVRRLLFEELQPVALANCELERFGEANDGGYLMCGNLLRSAVAAYSYGISGYDGWGCEVSRKTGIPVHQYDCFNPRRPVCEGGKTVFHDECVAGARFTDAAGRLFDTVEHQLARTGSGGKHVVMKMDVEGAEWDSLWKTPDEVLRRIDQIAIEMHGVKEEKFLMLLWKLKTYFHVAHVHFNNFACQGGIEPFPAWAYEVLFVNKDLATALPGRPQLPHALDARNNPRAPDCPAQPGPVPGRGTPPTRRP